MKRAINNLPHCMFNYKKAFKWVELSDRSCFLSLYYQNRYDIIIDDGEHTHRIKTNKCLTAAWWLPHFRSHRFLMTIIVFHVCSTTCRIHVLSLASALQYHIFYMSHAYRMPNISRELHWEFNTHVHGNVSVQPLP